MQVEHHPLMAGTVPQEADAPVAAASIDASSSAELQALRQAAVKFEAFFVAQLMQQMRKATAALADADSPLNDEVNQAPLAMADNAVADGLAGQGAFGIADVLVRQMAGPLLHASSAPLASTNTSFMATPVAPRNQS